MNLDEQLRAVFSQEAEVTNATRPPDIDGIIDGGLARRRRRSAARAGIAALVVLALGGGGYGITQLGSDTEVSPTISHRPTATNDASPGPAGDILLPTSVPLGPGTHRFPSSPTGSVTGYSITFPEGWTVTQQRVTFYKNQGGPGEMIIDPFVVDAIFRDACNGNIHSSGVPVPVGPGTASLIDALRDQGHGAAVSRPVPTTVGDRPATRIDLSVPVGVDVSDCRLPGALQVWRIGTSGYLAIRPGETIRVYILDVDGERQVFVTFASTASPADRAELEQVLDSIRIGS